VVGRAVAGARGLALLITSLLALGVAVLLRRRHLARAKARAEEEGRLELRPAPGKVAVVQGQVRVEGQRLRYQNDTGEALLAGPLEVRREGEKPLTGKAGSLRYLLDEDRLWLLGGVELTQEGRTTKAERALLREKEGYAYLYGGVESRDEKGLVRGERVRYALKSGEVVVLGQVRGEFRGD
ncbi:MAG: LPS export ABC transporter periplasmic protein LptC, partial [Thermus sp.]